MKQKRIDSEVGSIIVVRLRQMGKTQRWLADVLGSTPASINGLIKGRYKPSKRTLLVLAAVLEIDPKTLITVCTERQW